MHLQLPDNGENEVEFSVILLLKENKGLLGISLWRLSSHHRLPLSTCLDVSYEARVSRRHVEELASKSPQ